MFAQHQPTPRKGSVPGTVLYFSALHPENVTQFGASSEAMGITSPNLGQQNA